jgi:hypothetical protein
MTGKGGKRGECTNREKLLGYENWNTQIMEEEVRSTGTKDGILGKISTIWGASLTERLADGEGTREGTKRATNERRSQLKPHTPSHAVQVIRGSIKFT